jgi:hypothetical protein
VLILLLTPHSTPQGCLPPGSIVEAPEGLARRMIALGNGRRFPLPVHGDVLAEGTMVHRLDDHGTLARPAGG